MKKIYGFLGAAALLALASCSDNAQNGPVTPDNTKEGYQAQVRVSMANLGSRADNINNSGEDFKYGTDEENQVNSLNVVFYKNDGTVCGFGINRDATPTTDGSGDVEKVVTLYVNLLENAMPDDATQAVAFINITDTQWETLKSLTLSELQEEDNIVMSIIDNNGNNTLTNSGFVMSSAGYYKNNNYTIATSIPSGVIYEGTVKPDNYTPLTIYVERVTAKVQLDSLDETKINEVELTDTDGNGYALTFVPETWGVTAKAIKALGVKLMPETVADWMTAGSYGVHRTYWAKGYEYDNGTFPVATWNEETSDIPTDLETYTLSYITWNELTTLNSENIEYVGESTFPAETISNQKNPWAATTAIVIGGKYTVTDTEGEQAEDYTNGFFIITSAAGKHTIFTKEAAQANLFARLQNYVTKRVDGKAVQIEASEVTFKPLDAKYNTPSNSYYTTLTVNSTSPYYIIDAQTGSWKACTDQEELDKYIARYVGDAKEYAGNHAYFYVPLKHYKANYTGKDQYLTLTDLVEGNYGIVRNNWYVLTINSISGLAIGTTGNDTLLPRPDVENQDYTMEVELNVLQWHMRNQSVDL